MRKIIPMLLLFLSTSLYAQEFKNQIGFKSDNDSYLFQRQDRYYTNGLYLEWHRALNPDRIKGDVEKKILTLSIGQAMYNPSRGYAPRIENQDRPFAAYLYAGAGLTWFKPNESLFKSQVQLGVVGPKALGEAAQKFMHRILDQYEVAGWEHQISQEWAINASLQYAKKLFNTPSRSIDIHLESGIQLGNTYSNASAGLLLRTGSLNPMSESGYYQAKVAYGTSGASPKPEIFFYTKPQLNYVAYDATIRGSMFNDKSPVTFKHMPWVYEQAIGLHFSSARLSLDYHMSFKSRELKNSASSHQYGSLSVHYRF